MATNLSSFANLISLLPPPSPSINSAREPICSSEIAARLKGRRPAGRRLVDVNVALAGAVVIGAVAGAKVTSGRLQSLQSRLGPRGPGRRRPSETNEPPADGPSKWPTAEMNYCQDQPVVYDRLRLGGQAANRRRRSERPLVAPAAPAHCS